jgi:hypothetical protein
MNVAEDLVAATSTHPENGGSIVLRNVGILHHYTLKMEVARFSETLVSHYILKTEAVWSSETLVSHHITTS